MQDHRRRPRSRRVRRAPRRADGPRRGDRRALPVVLAARRRGGWRDRGFGLTPDQAAHELRHKRRLSAFLSQVRTCLLPGGLFLYCDHYAESASAERQNLFLSQADQPVALGEANFTDVRRGWDDAIVRDKPWMILDVS